VYYLNRFQMLEQTRKMKGFTGPEGRTCCIVSRIHIHTTNPYKIRLCGLQNCPLSCKHRSYSLLFGHISCMALLSEVSLLCAVISCDHWIEECIRQRLLAPYYCTIGHISHTDSYDKIKVLRNTSTRISSTVIPYI
jgi:hypothetical protein